MTSVLTVDLITALISLVANWARASGGLESQDAPDPDQSPGVIIVLIQTRFTVFDMPKESDTAMMTVASRGQQARRRRSFARMSEQEIQAVFAALEPRSMRALRKWACLLIAAAIAVGLALLFVMRAPDRSSQVPATIPAVDKAASREPTMLYQAADPDFDGWESVRSFSAPGGMDFTRRAASAPSH